MQRLGRGCRRGTDATREPAATDRPICDREDAAGLFVPFEELPESSRELYTYDPERARKMLADAGYPDGFKTILNTADILGWPTLAAAVKDQWSKIGVEAEVMVHEGEALSPVTVRPDQQVFSEEMTE